MSEKLEQLRAMSIEELVKRHDELSKTTIVEINHYLDEIYRRDNQLINKRMLRLTQWITIMTIIMTIATLVNIVLFIIV